MVWLVTWLLLLVQAPPEPRLGGEMPERYFVTTTDSAAFSQWLVANGLRFRPRRLGRFELKARPEHLEALSDAPGVVGVEPIRRQRTQDLDASRSLIRAELAHLGLGLSRAHRGTGALVGIVDNGFDLAHPAFQDSSGKSRILRLWDHTNASGSPPAGFTTGSLFAGDALNALGRSGTLIHHGTHVAGLAAARSVPGSGGDWWGVADDARLALVDCGPGCAALDEGIEYIYRLADSLGLPAVVNLSWGNHEGPRDGKGSDCVLLGSLLGPGKLATASAGNAGAYAGHAVHAFPAIADTVRLALEVADGAQTSSTGDTLRRVSYAKLELWGDSARTFRAWVEFLDSAGTLLATSASQTAGRSAWKTIALVNPLGQDTFWVEGNVEMRSRKGGMNLTAYSNRKGIKLRVGITAADNTVHGWTLEEGKAFLQDTSCIGCVVPDQDHMLSDKSTCPLQIAVGSVDELGAATWFTSKGPGLARNPKPDVSAPGLQVISTLNAAAGAWPTSGSWNGHAWGPMSGTSMSAPLVAGALALLLEQDPGLTTDSALSLLKGGADRHDPAVGWSILDVGRMLEGLDPARTLSLASRSRAATGARREWLTAKGARTVVPAGADPMRHQPEGIAWLRTCDERGCSVRGLVRP